MSDSTCLVVPVSHGEGLVCRLGDPRSVVVDYPAYAAAATASKTGQVMAVWRMNGYVTLEQAKELAALIQPTSLLICSSEDFGTLRLDRALETEVDVIDDRAAG